MNIKLLFLRLITPRSRPTTLKDRQQQSNNPAFLLLSSIVFLFSLSLLDTIIGWILLLVICSAIIRCAIFFAYQKHIPTLRTLNLLAILSIVGLAYSAWPLGLLITMVNLLVLACALKLMQVRTQRDVYQLITSLFFLIGCGFIFHQSMAYTLLYALLIFGVIIALGFFHAPQVDFKQQLKRTLILTLQALPIGLLLFFLMPQLPPLWQTPKAKSMETGLADKITPGDIAQLSQSSELAFRATFKNQAPMASERYWRAIVMEDFDGRSWQVHSARKQQRQINQFRRQEFSPVLTGSTIDYDVIAEPTQQNWLFGLDIATPLSLKSQGEIWQSADFLLISQQKLHSKYHYSVRSYTQAISAQTTSEFDRQLSLQTPQQGNPRTQKWISQLRAQYPNDQDLIRVLLTNFTQENFVYTLRPKPMFIDPIDVFLFEERAGFCSHYASAMAYSLRLAGIPARIVAGYQGGELVAKPNQEQYLSVYQYDAHAWVEAWDKQTGWQRIDPTAAVAPERITMGLRQAMLDEGSFLADSPFALAKFTNIALFNNLRLFLADMDYNWSRWVIGFDQQKQQALFKRIVGTLTTQRLALLGLAIVSFIAILLGLFFVPHWLRQKPDPMQEWYMRAVKLIESHIGARPSWQGPQDFDNHVNKKLPTTVSQTFADITELYVQIKYRASNDIQSIDSGRRQSLKSIKNAVKRLKKQLKGLPHHKLP